jgi:hypothetical protein
MRFLSFGGGGGGLFTKAEQGLRIRWESHCQVDLGHVLKVFREPVRGFHDLQEPHGITSQKMAVFIVTAVTTTDLT